MLIAVLVGVWVLVLVSGISAFYARKSYIQNTEANEEALESLKK